VVSFSVPNKKNETGLEDRPLQLQERGSDPTERASARDFSGDWVLDRESWVDPEM
jgi:hypothetical protein